MRVASRVDAGSLLEREDELAEISRCLADARAGGGALTLLEGPAGIGKTRLLLEAQRAARAAGMTVLRAHGSELERDFPYGVVRQLVEPSLAARTDAERAELLSGAAALAAPLFAVEPELRAGAPGTAALLPSAERPGAVLHGLYRLFAALAAREPCSSPSTMRTGPTAARCASSATCSPGSRSCRSPCSLPHDPVRRRPSPSCSAGSR